MLGMVQMISNSNAAATKDVNIMSRLMPFFALDMSQRQQRSSPEDMGQKEQEQDAAMTDAIIGQREVEFVLDMVQMISNAAAKKDADFMLRLMATFAAYMRQR